MKRTVCALLIAAMLVTGLTACGESPVSKPAAVEGAIFGGQSDDSIAVDVTFDTSWLTKKSNTKYNAELAQFCALLSADSYFRTKDLDKQRQNRVLFADADAAEYDFTSFLTSFGFTEAEHFESYLAQTDPTDTNDSVTLNIGHQTVDGKYDVYAVVIRGCFSAGEWKSAFDPGCESAGYEAMTGGHPEWTDSAAFKGVDVAANRAIAFIEDFMSRTGDAALPDRLLITGHSRGGGIANLLGAHFENDADVTSYTYTFNALGVTLAEDAADYSTIFNIYDSGDFFIAGLPFADGGFVRYGRDMPMAAGGDKTKSVIAELKGRDDYTCVPAET